MKTRHPLALLPIAALSALLASPALADGGLQRVEVNGRNVGPERHDVHRVCQDVDSSLRRGIANVWSREQPVGEMTVHFQLEGSQVREVHTEGMGGLRYNQTRYAIQRAVHSFSCDSDEQVPQQFAFRIVIVAPQDRSADSPQLALLERR